MTGIEAHLTERAGPASTFADAVHAEWTKFRTLRSIRSMVVAVFVLALGFGALYSAGSGNMYAKRAPADQHGFDPANVSLAGGLLMTQLAITVLGVLVVSSEYNTGTIRTSLTVVPSRIRLYLAKAVFCAAVVLVIGQVAAFGAFLLGQPVLDSVGAPTTTLSQPHVLRAVVGGGLFLALTGLLGFVCGFLIRSAAAAMSTGIAVVLIVPMLLGFAPAWLRQLYPVTAGQQVSYVEPVTQGLQPLPGLGLYAGSMVVLLVVSYAVFWHRDA